jgi:hypothetical protein
MRAGACRDVAAVRALRRPALAPQAEGEPVLRVSQKNETAIQRLIAAVKISGKFLAPDRWRSIRSKNFQAPAKMMQDGLPVSTARPVGVSLPVAVSTANTTMLSLSRLAA